MVEEPPDPGIQLITDPHQDGDMTTAELAGEQVPVFQQAPPEAGGDYCHGPHQAVGQANTNVEYMEINKWDTGENEEDVDTETAKNGTPGEVANVHISCTPPKPTACEGNRVIAQVKTSQARVKVPGRWSTLFHTRA